MEETTGILKPSGWDSSKTTAGALSSASKGTLQHLREFSGRISDEVMAQPNHGSGGSE